jgi:hypothetical protein
LLGSSPEHTPRPAYYAYLLYADHFGPTLLDVSSLPPGVSAHASRNQADDATEVIVVNWNLESSALSFQVTGLPNASPPPSAPSFVLPATSLAAVEIRDNGPASAVTYGEAERAAALAPQPLVPGVSPPPSDAGAEGGAGKIVGSHCAVGSN